MISLLKQSIKELELLHRPFVGLDMSYNGFNDLCGEAWKEGEYKESFYREFQKEKWKQNLYL